MSETLTAIYDGRRVGQMHYENDRITFRYAGEWQDSPDAFPLSLSMPLNRHEHPDKIVRPFISGLLPDDSEVLRRWGKKFHVSERNPFRLLRHIGEECASAVQFVTPERAATWLEGDVPHGVDWLSGDEFVERIRELVADSSEARRLGDEGHFSLAGAQAKTGLYRDRENKRWGIPKGATPTSHIIKPNRGEFHDFEINEHYCLRLATRLGLSAAKSWTETIGRIPVIIIERYDRIWVGDRLTRIHQEDTCQALARMPERKYQNEGGPSAQDIFDLIRNHSSRPQEDVLRFLDALIFNYLIAGSDAHAKNYSLLIAGGGQVRLAKLYDLISILPYPNRVAPRKIKLAMKIGDEYRHYQIGPREWEKSAAEWKLDMNQVFGRIIAMAEKLPEASQATAREIAGAAAGVPPILDDLVRAFTDSAEGALKIFR